MSDDYQRGIADGRAQAYHEFALALAFQKQEIDEACDCAGHALTAEFLANPSAHLDFTISNALAKHNAQGEIDNAIANAFRHFPLPGGLKGRYHDTLCGESINWTHVAHYRDDDVEGARRAIEEVTCPVCLEALEEL